MTQPDLLEGHEAPVHKVSKHPNRAAALKDRKDDLYETAPIATRSLVRLHDTMGARYGLEPLPAKVWEPCGGRDAIATELRAAGREVYSEDLIDRGVPGQHTPRDFLMTGKLSPIDCPPEHRGVIVSNPPYKLADDMMRHALFDLKVPTVIMLLRLLYEEGQGRSDIIDHHLRHVWLGRERLPMMHRDGYEGTKMQKESGMPFAWFVFTAEKTSGSWTTQRFSWRELGGEFA